MKEKLDPNEKKKKWLCNRLAHIHQWVNFGQAHGGGGLWGGAGEVEEVRWGFWFDKALGKMDTG